MPRITLIICALALALTACGKKPSPTIRIAASSSLAALPVLVADEEGFFAAEGVKTVVTSCITGRKCMDMLLDGKVDVATASDVPIMLDAFERGGEFSVIGTIATSSTDIKLITTNTTITEAKQLEKKRIGVTLRTGNKYFLDTYLLANGVDPRNVTIVPLQPNEMLNALRTNKVDVVSIWEPIAHEIGVALGDKVRVIISPGTYTVTFNLVIPRRAVGTADAKMTAVLRAISRAEELIKVNPVRAKQILAAKLNISPQLVEQIWADYTFRLSLTAELVSTLESEARWALREGYVVADRVPAYTDLIYPEPIRRSGQQDYAR